MNLGISDKTFLVTGSSRGIGNSIAKSLLEEGARVLLVARNEDMLAKVSESFVKKYGKKGGKFFL